MEQHGWLRCRVDAAGGRTARRFYSTTARARAVLERARTMDAELHAEIGGHCDHSHRASRRGSERKILSKQEYGALGEDFEKKEHQLFGEDGFEKMVDRVASIEKMLGIYDLAQFTPHVE